MLEHIVIYCHISSGFFFFSNKFLNNDTEHRIKYETISEEGSEYDMGSSSCWKRAFRWFS